MTNRIESAILSVILLCAPALAQTQTAVFHVTGVRNIAPNDPEPISRGPRVFVITGTMDGKRYVTQQLFTFGCEHLTVGADYAVTKANDKLIEVNVPRKGRKNEERLRIVGVEEAPLSTP